MHAHSEGMRRIYDESDLPLRTIYSRAASHLDLIEEALSDTMLHRLNALRP